MLFFIALVAIVNTSYAKPYEKKVEKYSKSKFLKRQPGH